MLLDFTKQQLFSSVNSHYSAIGDIIIYYITWMGQPEVIIPGLVLLMFIPVFRNRQYFFLALICNIIPFVTQQLLKRVWHDPRPLKYFDHALWIHYLPAWGPELLRDSFPSGHSQGAFSFFSFLSLLLPSKYRWLGIVFFIMALSVCYSRLYLAAHFFEDVYTGSLIGGCTTMLLFSILNQTKFAGINPDRNTWFTFNFDARSTN